MAQENQDALSSGAHIQIQLFISFLKVGFFMFGGGYAMIPLLEQELIQKRKWISNDDLLEIISFSQMTPGTIAINAATYIGNEQGKTWGGLVASLGIIFPSLLIISLVYHLAGSHFDLPWLQNAFLGIRACLVAMIGKSVFKLFKSGIKGNVSIAIFLLALIALLIGAHPILIIILGGIVGFITFKITLK
ncbi:chromate transporter [Fulvivirga sediminis]|uniref:Chromate transporter n=1 Tax=Fulvivirga sediminis TaxID=2803949 RepID=A0A937FA55_9BACT|nr:chromate transporter [Fulvivirga sediminis]MBL3657105.1 chromate transporter [Fulvivirga sediminis]